MNVIVHYPKDPESLDILRKRTAAVHAEAVIKYIQKLPCPKEQKIDLLDSLIKEEGLPR
jgi:hypothetical protein